MVGAISLCQSYFPIIYRNGNLKVQDGRGQGVLLVEGDLEVRGNFEFTGLVIVRGELSTNGTGNKITGGVLAKNADLGDSRLHRQSGGELLRLRDLTGAAGEPL